MRRGPATAATLRSLLLVALFGLAGVAGCGNDAVCPLGTAGSPCRFTTEPGDRPEVPSAGSPDTFAPDALPRDGVDGDGEGNDSGAPEATDAPGPDDNSDTSAVHGSWAAALASIAAVRGNDAPGRGHPDTNDAGGLSAAAAALRGAPFAGGSSRRGLASARTDQTETGDGTEGMTVGDAGAAPQRDNPRRDAAGAPRDLDPV